MKKLTEYTKQQLQQIAYKATSAHQMLILMGYSPNGGTSKTTLKRLINKFNIDVKHMQAKRYSEDQILRQNSVYTSKRRLKNILTKYKGYKCQICGNQGQWNNKPLALQLDHINGNSTDNRLENLRFLCPNCHSQTQTFAGRNKE